MRRKESTAKRRDVYLKGNITHLFVKGPASQPETLIFMHVIFLLIFFAEKAKVEAKRADKEKEKRKDHFRKAGQEEVRKEKEAAKAATRAERPVKRRKTAA